MSELRIPSLAPEKKAEGEPEQEQAQTQTAIQGQAVQAPAVPAAPAPSKPDPFHNVYTHEYFWRHFNDSLEPAHGVLLSIAQKEPETQAKETDAQKTSAEAQGQVSHTEDVPGFITKYWPWIAVSVGGIVVIALALSFMRKRRDDDGDDFRRREPEPPPPPPQQQQRYTNPIDEYLPYR